MGVAAHRVSLGTFFSTVALGTPHDVPGCEDRQVGLPARSHTPATLCRLLRVPVFASTKKSYPAADQLSDGAARRCTSSPCFPLLLLAHSTALPPRVPRSLSLTPLLPLTVPTSPPFPTI